MEHYQHRNFYLTAYNQALRLNAEDIIRRADAAYIQRLFDIVMDIYTHRDSRALILLSGPSGSGKTTTAYLIEQMLDRMDCETHTLSMDNYFLPLPQTDHDLVMQGKIDLESPARINHDLLNSQLADMIACRPVTLPKYDFARGVSSFSDITLTRKPGELVILEGIHALNPSVVTIPDEKNTRIYVSVRTRVHDGEQTLHPSKIRLLRRMLRDRNFRDRPLDKTLHLFDSVELGEQRYIMPYKHRSNYDVDTFIDYELSVMKCLYTQLVALPCADREKLSDILTVLEHTEPIQEQLIPQNSLLREFIGGSEFHY